MPHERSCVTSTRQRDSEGTDPKSLRHEPVVFFGSQARPAKSQENPININKPLIFLVFLGSRSFLSCLVCKVACWTCEPEIPIFNPRFTSC